MSSHDLDQRARSVQLGRVGEPPTVAQQVPAQLRVLYAPARCDGTGDRDLVGQLSGIHVRVTEDYHPKPPYTATFVSDAGDGLGLDRYSSVTVQLRVTSTTEAGADPHFLRPALGRGERAQATVGCDGRRFVATAFTLR